MDWLKKWTTVFDDQSMILVKEYSTCISFISLPPGIQFIKADGGAADDVIDFRMESAIITLGWLMASHGINRTDSHDKSFTSWRCWHDHSFCLMRIRILFHENIKFIQYVVYLIEFVWPMWSFCFIKRLMIYFRASRRLITYNSNTT